MRTDLIGGEEIVAHIAALQEQLEIAQGQRNDAAERMKQATATDTDAAVEALRAGATAPKLTHPAAERVWDEAERHLTVVSLALKKEREALTADIVSRSASIAADLSKREDALQKEVFEAIDSIESKQAELAEVRSHRAWVRNGATGSLGGRQVAGEREVRAFRAAVAVEESATDREAYLRNYDAWKALVEAAHATVPTAWRNAHSGEEITAACDKAVEREIERREEAGEGVPTPTSVKWGLILGTGKFAGRPDADPPPEPDLDSAAARHSDNVRS